MPARKLTFVLLLCLLSFAPAVYAQEAAKPARDERLIEVKIPAPALKGNLVADPIEQSVIIYLPPGYDASPTKRFPTVYLLHGFLGDAHAWTSGGYQGLSLRQTMDEMIKKGSSREMIVVAPNGKNAYLGSFYTNSVVNGNWEDYIFRDLIAYVDANYRTIARPESRGIAGHSMGGYGAVVIGMKHPEVFSAIYALSPCCLGLEGDFGPTNPAWLKTIRLTSKDQLKTKIESFDDFYKVAFVALSAAFSPNPERGPFYADFPFQERDGRVEKNEPAYAKWKSKMPLYMIEENKQNLLKLRGIFIDYGQNEEFTHIQISGRLFSTALAERGIPHTFEIYEGGNHISKIRQRVETRVFQFFSEKLDFAGPP
ncbi:MAG: alpha/beta fold hydrolase [bacterium]